MRNISAILSISMDGVIQAPDCRGRLCGFDELLELVSCAGAW